MEKKEHTKVNTNPKVEQLLSFEAFSKWIKESDDNIKEFYNMGDVRGRWAERRLQELFGDRDRIIEANQNTYGYDLLIDGFKWEVKSTSSIQDKLSKYKTSYLQIGGLKSKENECHGIIFLDLVNYRMFRIEHDDFFKNDNIKLIPQGNDYSFRWFVDYDENKYYKNGKYRSETLSKNTIAIKQYER